MRRPLLSIVVAGAAALVAAAPEAGLARAGGRRAVEIPAGSYMPLYGASAPRRVAAFRMDVSPVTNGEYLEFVRAHPAWRRSRVAPVLADRAYLSHWAGDLELGDRAPADSPVVHVSWFAARAFLAAAGERLPTEDQWEYVAVASETRRDASRDPAFLARLRASYGKPRLDPLPPVGQSARNVYGVRGLHDLVHEWVDDFNSALVTGESRGDAALDRSLFCGSGVVGAADARDYAAFLRYAFRSSLDARYSLAHLGFRGAAPAQRPAP